MVEVENKVQRYGKYKDSEIVWLGEIPQHWELKKLKFIVKVHSGNGFPIDEQGLEINEVPFFKVSDINGNYQFIEYSNNYVSWKKVKQNKWNIIPIHSIVAAKIGEALRKNHRKITLVESIIDNNCIAFEPINVDFKYSYFLHSIIDFDWFSNPGAVPSISVSKYKNFYIPLPPLQEQIKISEYLDNKTTKLDDAIGIKTKQINLLRERKQILIHKAVTRGLDDKVKLKNSRVDWIGEIPKHWEVKRLKYVFKILKRIAGELGHKVLSITQKGIKVKDVESGGGQLSMDYSKYQIVEKADFAMNHMDLLTGYVDISKYQGVISPDYRVFNLIDNTCEKNYILLLLQLGYRHKIFYAHGQGVSMLGRWRFPSDNFNNFRFPIPPLSEQKVISAYIETASQKIETAIGLKQQEITKLKEYKSSLINGVVTGKVKVC